jgi:hypothetical protein
MIDQVFKQLIEICRVENDGVAISNAQISDEVFIQTLIDVAVRSGVAPWCYFQLAQQVTQIESSESLLKPLRKHYLITLAANQHHLKLLRAIELLFSEAAIPVVLLKGMALAYTVYADEGLRPMGDLDLLVPEQEVMKARDILLLNGGSVGNIPLSLWHEASHGHVRAIRFGSSHRLIELHARLYSLGNQYQPLMPEWSESIEKRLTPYGPVFVLIRPLMAYHLCSHLYYGFLMGGIRLGWLVDIAIIFEKSDNPEELMQQMLKVKPGVNDDLIKAVGWAYEFMSPRVRETLLAYRKFFVPLPEPAIFLRQEGFKVNHRLMVWKEIMRTPGLINKVSGFWFQFFPSFEYMQHYCGAKWKLLLPYYYLKRLTGRCNVL